MCGIVGFLGVAAQPDSVLEAMTASLAHRGPDADGFHRDGALGLGHRRLAVIDVEASRQPMVSADGRYVIVYNGELYNFAALRDELVAAGREFRTRGDTEVLLQAYAHWGEAVLERLQGMFAFAVWDKQRRSLFLARDQLGVKPLHYAWDGRTLVFGSELKALLAHPAVSREIDLNAIGLYLESQFIASPFTIYRSVRKLDAGHAMLLEGGQLRIWRYWLPDYSPKFAFDEAEALAALEKALRVSVQSMLVADVPLGSFLSGGIDSSLISALITDLRGAPIDTFHLGFEGRRTESEHEQAAIVARHIGSRHHVLMLTADELLAGFDRFAAVYDEPFGDPAALPTLLLAGLARQHVTVALTGEGADEVFAGYGNYARRAAEERLTRVLGARGSPVPAMLRLLPPKLRKDRLLKAIATPRSRRYVTIPNVFDHLLKPGLFSAPLMAAQQVQMADAAERFFDECNSGSYIDRVMYVDLRLWLPDDLLVKVDRATMAHSLEARVPYLDHRFVEFAARLDPGLKQRGLTTKYLLKQLAQKYLPDEIVHRRKQGFVPPLVEWFAGQLDGRVRTALSPQGLGGRGLFRAG